MTSLNRNGNKILDLSLDEIIELEQKKNESARRANLAALRCDKDEPMVVTNGDQQSEKNEIRAELPVENNTRPLSRCGFSWESNPRKNKSLQGNKVRKGYRAYNNRGGFSSGYQNYHQRNKSYMHKKTQHNCRRRQEVTTTQWAYLHHLRSVRNSQGFALISGESPLTRNRTSTPNGSLIYPLTRTFLRRFDSSLNSNSRISLLSLGSTVRSCGSVRSVRSNCSYHQCNCKRSIRSNKSTSSNKSAKLPCNPGVADEIALLQSSLVDDPNYDKIIETNRQPLTSLTASSTNLTLSSRFSSYYDPPE